MRHATFPAIQYIIVLRAPAASRYPGMRTDGMSGISRWLIGQGTKRRKGGFLSGRRTSREDLDGYYKTCVRMYGPMCACAGKGPCSMSTKGAVYPPDEESRFLLMANFLWNKEALWCMRLFGWLTSLVWVSQNYISSFIITISTISSYKLIEEDMHHIYSDKWRNCCRQIGHGRSSWPVSSTLFFFITSDK